MERRFRGQLRLTASAVGLRTVVRMSLETAVASIVAAESPPNAPPSFLEAQAVVSRSYLLSGARHRGFDFCDTTHCQYLREPPPAESSAARATGVTQGLVLAYHGRVVRALYSRSCGGETRSLSEAGLQPDGGYPFFSVTCEYCVRHPERWRESFEPDDLSGLLDSRSEAARLQVARTIGWSRLPSTRFQAEESDGVIVLHGEGIGHGVGLCQRGAAALAATDADFGAILGHFFPNTVLAAPPR
jgi:stage II sporulation protein D